LKLEFIAFDAKCKLYIQIYNLIYFDMNVQT